jgi:3' terminal RNA ribose 2'-O-methyltransferase Hen1
VLLTITSTHQPNATDLGYLLHKNPTRIHRTDLPFGKACVFYPEATAERCTAAVLVEVDSVSLVRSRGPAPTLDTYVNDRPYVCSSFTSVAIGSLFGTALSGRSKDRPDLVSVPLTLELRLSTVKARGGIESLRRLFEPLGYEVETEVLPLETAFPEWGLSRCLDVTLRNRITVHDALTHLYVLLPVLDDFKHYYIGEAEVEKLLRHGEGWLAAHPNRDYIVERYLQRHRYLIEDAMQRLLAEEAEEVNTEEKRSDQGAGHEESIEQPMRLHELRLDTVAAKLVELGARRVVDFGCGNGRLMQRLVANSQFIEIVGVDVSHRALEMAARRLKADRQGNRVRLLQGSLVYRDSRLDGYDAVAIVEVIEHLDPPRLAALERAVFDTSRPRAVIITTPNREYNALFPTLPAGKFRHSDHRFEWTRAEFEDWANHTAQSFRYRVTFQPLGPVDESAGAPSQMAVFQRED